MLKNWFEKINNIYKWNEVSDNSFRQILNGQTKFNFHHIDAIDHLHHFKIKECNSKFSIVNVCGQILGDRHTESL